MPKSKAEHAEALRSVKAAWPTRGYRPDLLSGREHERIDDPTGELAYQRAFAEAAKKDPPRLPNPSHYSNSASAQALIQRQNMGIFNSQQHSLNDRLPNPKYESPMADVYRPIGESDNHYPTMKYHRSTSSTPTIASHHPSPIIQQQQQVGVRYTTAQNGQHAMSSPTPGGGGGGGGGRNPPLLMEPKMDAPMGPPSRFR